MTLLRFKAPKTCHVKSNGALVMYSDYAELEKKFKLLELDLAISINALKDCETAGNKYSGIAAADVASDALNELINY